MLYEYNGGLHSSRSATKEEEPTMDVKEHTSSSTEKKPHVQESQIVWLPWILEQIQGPEKHSHIIVATFKTTILPYNIIKITGLSITMFTITCLLTAVLKCLPE